MIKYVSSKGTDPVYTSSDFLQAFLTINLVKGTHQLLCNPAACMQYTTGLDRYLKQCHLFRKVDGKIW
jgi:hypothetical protein